MGLVLINPATEWPVSLAEAKAWAVIEDDARNAMVARLIAAATGAAESYLGRKLAVQTWKQTIDTWPCGGAIELALEPVTAVTVSYYNTDGLLVEFDAANWLLDMTSKPQWVVLADDAEWPDLADRINAVELELTVGYAANVPDDIRQAILITVAAWFDSRESGDFPAGARALLDRHRRIAI